MRNAVQDTFIRILRQTVCGGDPVPAEALSPDMLKPLCELAKKHDMAHLLPDALRSAGLPVDKDLAMFQYRAVWRYEQQNYVLQELCSALEAAQIPFIPLKGAVIRPLYPEPWMRTSADLDVLVRPEDFSRAKKLLVQQLGYEWEFDELLNASLHTPADVHLELHHTLLDPVRFPDIVKVLDSVWGSSTLAPGRTYQFVMPNELFYFYHLAHMFKHFSASGGCGVRSILDLWLLEHRFNQKKEQLNDLVGRAGITAFATAVQTLAESWFSNIPCPDMDTLEQCIFSGGLYGTQHLGVAFSHAVAGGHIKYFFKRIFPPYETIADSYSIVRRHKWLTPLFWVVRWSHLFQSAPRRHAMQDIQAIKRTRQLDKETIILIRHLGI